MSAEAKMAHKDELGFVLYYRFAIWCNKMFRKDFLLAWSFPSLICELYHFLPFVLFAMLETSVWRSTEFETFGSEISKVDVLRTE